jgi:hypothetical protein
MQLRLDDDTDEFLLDDSHLEVRPDDLRIAYFGVGLCGKTTNLKVLEHLFNGVERPAVEWVKDPSLESDRTLYYDADGLGGAAAIALATFGTARPILTAGDFILAA